jgi:uncharacterized membrane protein (DUF485 family)
MSKTHNWEAIAASPRFKQLIARKRVVLSGLMLFSICYYFLLPLGAAYYHELFKRQVWGPVNVGLVFALSEFVVAWTVAVIYSRVANKEFDVLAAKIVADAEASK